MAHPSRRERRGEVTIDSVAQSNEDPGCKTGLGLRQDPCQGLGRAQSQRLECAARVVGRRLDLKRPSRERPDRADPQEVGTVRRVGSRSDLTLDHHLVTRGHDRIARKGRGDLEGGSWTRRRPERRCLLPIPWRARRTDDEQPRAAAVGRMVQRRRRRRDHEQARRNEAGTEHERQNRNGPKIRPRLTDEQQRGQRQRNGGSEVARGYLPSRHRRGDGPDRKPTAAAHLRAPSRDP